MLQVAENVSDRALLLKDLPEGHHRAYVFAKLKELAFLLVGVQNEFCVESPIDIHFKVLAFNLFDLLLRLQFLHVIFLKLDPFLITIPVIVDIIDEVAAVAGEAQVSFDLSLWNLCFVTSFFVFFRCFHY